MALSISAETESPVVGEVTRCQPAGIALPVSGFGRTYYVGIKFINLTTEDVLAIGEVMAAGRRRWKPLPPRA